MASKGPGSKKSPSTAAAPPAPTPTNSQFPIVGIGASAGGLAAFEAFFSGMPDHKDPGMAFVLVQHLAPDHSSLLTELMQRHTRMQVVEVTDGMLVQINCAYIIPPNRDMAFLNGALHLLEPSAPRGHRLPIDFLFRSLAQDQRERAIGIVLSGTGSDGTLGLRAIKDEGGMAMVQNPASAEYDGMPRSSLATGLVDYELPPAEMPAQLMAYVAHAFGRPPRAVTTTSAPQTENALKKIFILLRTHTSHDFSQYKPSTIYRRIERRMAVHQIDALDDYVKFLQHTTAEVDALFNDLLIGVTNFFRDPEAFEVLETQVVPKLFEGKPAGAVVRAWSAGCSTGEEAYSIAILLQERLEALKLSYKVQVFATDIDSRAIATARAGLYPASIAEDITPERLARFFTAEPDGSAYRVHKSIRDMLVFSEHNLVKDPPFSKLDLISCRNLLIYMGSDLQKKVMALFHYALLPGGMLFLGSSETVGELGDVFAVLDRKAKAYQRKEDFQGAQRAALGRFLPPAAIKDVTLPPASGKLPTPLKLSLRALTEQTLLLQLAPVAALVNAQGDILYLHGRTGMFLEPAPGEAGINNIVKMAREGLRRELTTALHKAANSKERVQTANLRVKTNGHFTPVNLTVCPVDTGPPSALESPLYLVVLEEAPAQEAPAQALPLLSASNHTQDTQAQIAELNEELQAKEEYLHAANEELETSNEELKSSNEEMQSINEELQSTNEELETSKEELQSINEELATVNTELQTKVTDLSRANNDMNNLLAGTGIGTIFLDHALHILRFTPAVTQIIHLILSDVGRPVGHIASNLVGYDRLVADVQQVLVSLQAHEIDVQTIDRKHYTMRILPYRTQDNVVEGVVITFVDITEMVRTREALRTANEQLRLAVVVRDAFDAITVQDLNGSILAWNPGAVRMYGWSETEALAMNVSARIPAAQHGSALARVQQLSQAQTLEPYLTQRLAKDGSVLEVSLTSTALLNASGQVYAIATTERAKEVETGQQNGGGL
ncbi:MCP methyltransferase/methylesterase, CheR/CheB with PAS/PAC sensor [Rhodoferax sp. OV413]|uniref:chemotaxis protein CheB n=1 Tax=Rhodoferax sp. OV413 TaxID=1855285 RepID=UPI0008915A33|nr:chemotaxis protein CheB [Rhodoferax sp. OV413]SDP46860.1 MCP methyltransferase/methylesterase, CheR/CheB with PAS/PAC sensor [Rhodoferax sp. OV413]